MTDHDDMIDEKLRAAFAPPPAPVHAAAARAAIDGPGRAPRWPWLVAAAALAVLAVLLATMRNTREPAPHDGRALGAMWVAAYEHAVSKGDAGSFCCDPNSDFARACEQRFAARIVLGARSSEITLCGCYCGLPVGECCVAALARTAAGPIGIFAMSREADPAPQLPPGSSLQLTRRELGSVVLYALSSAPASDSLERFRLAP